VAGAIPIEMRDFLLTDFRQEVCRKMEVVPFEHQAKWWAAADGFTLSNETPTGNEPQMEVQLKDKSYAKRRLYPRMHGRARIIADLGSFKIGKSFGSGLWATGFAAVPDARVKLIGLEYDACAPEFEYLVEFLCSERGMNMKYDSLQNRLKDGRMWLEFPNGARFEARSWERADGLKGKEDDAYIYCEAYQLPGLECYTSFKQNLDARTGYAVFPTTPDRPWVKVFHEHGHGDPAFPDWQCVCGVSRDVNPYAFRADQREQDRQIMTREKFAIHYEGKLGDFVGSVFGYQVGQRQFTQQTHPDVWKDKDAPATLANFKIPKHWELLAGGDTGTHYAASIVAFNENGDAFVLEEFPNYRYVGGTIEADPETTIPEWAAKLRKRLSHYGMAQVLRADQNSQFKSELRKYGLAITTGEKSLETRTEIMREYFQHHKIWFAPWLSVIPYEVEQAQWPKDESATGKFQRIKKKDHSLDTVEHVLASRPRADRDESKDDRLWVEQFVGQKLRSKRSSSWDPHMGAA
jgi:hypothetical protein